MYTKRLYNKAQWESTDPDPGQTFDIIHYIYMYMYIFIYSYLYIP